MLGVQILPFKLPLLPISCEMEAKEEMMNERAGHDRGLAVRGKWKAMERQDN